MHLVVETEDHLAVLRRAVAAATSCARRSNRTPQHEVDRMSGASRVVLPRLGVLGARQRRDGRAFGRGCSGPPRSRTYRAGRRPGLGEYAVTTAELELPPRLRAAASTVLVLPDCARPSIRPREAGVRVAVRARRWRPASRPTTRGSPSASVACSGQRCQKHPSTYTATFARVNTRSARRRSPRIGATSTRYRKPRRHTARRRASSGSCRGGSAAASDRRTIVG